MKHNSAASYITRVTRSFHYTGVLGAMLVIRRLLFRAYNLMGLFWHVIRVEKTEPFKVSSEFVCSSHCLVSCFQENFEMLFSLLLTNS